MSPESPDLSIVLPTYQERETLGALFDGLLALDGLLEIVVVDDDSPDGTWQVAEDKGREEPRVRLIRRMHERGLTSAIRDGVRAARGEIVAWMDCDMRPRDLAPLVERVRGGVDAAIASRYVPGGRDGRDDRLHRMLSWIICRSARLALYPSIADYTSGLIAVRRRLLDGFAFADDYGEYFIALVHHLMRCGATVVEVPYTLTSRTGGTSKTATNPLGFLVRGRKYVATIARVRREMTR